MFVEEARRPTRRTAKSNLPRSLMPEEIVLRQGCLYRARIELGLFEQSVENAEIGRRLVEAGFVNVVVAGEGRSRLAEGRWPLEAREAFLPEQVRSVEEVEER